MTTYYKVLGHDHRPCHGGSGTWPEPGKWLSVSGEIVPCLRGLHLTDRAHLVEWLGPEIWIAEVHPKATVADNGNKIAVSRARLVSRVDAWNERTQRLFAAACAEHVLPIFEKRYPDDDRPRRAIETARLFADGRATAEELENAYAAAAYAAAYAYAAYAAYVAANAAANAYAANAAYVAAYAADAAYAAANAAANAYAASRSRERKWQSDTLAELIGLAVK
jgi:hypothetical protein